ncbi:hypothetical protein KCU94_g17837, partial [Aureobasidium melanogenum]
MDEPQSEIYDPFDELSPSERSESISKALAQFGKRMEDSNKRIVERLLDTIAKTDGHEELHLDMLATHLDKDTTETMQIKARTDELENTCVWDPAITRLSDFVLTDSGISTWSEETTHDYITGFLERLVLAVRANASRELLADTTIDNLQLPAAFCEFTRQCAGLSYGNYEREMFLCDFASQHFGESQMAQPLDKMRQYCGQTRHYEFVAGWKAGDNYNNCVIYYALTLRYDEPDEPWQWRIFVNNWEFHEWQGPFDDIFSFMDWYSDRYRQVEWDDVKASIDDIYDMCKVRYEIEDEFSQLSPTERYDSMAGFLSQFSDHMVDNNTRILSRLLDMISETEGDEALYLNILASHLDKESNMDDDAKQWPGDNEEFREYNSLNDFKAHSGIGNDSGICPWEPGTSDHIAAFLLELETAVRKNASRDLLGSTVETLELPSEFREFFKHTGGVFYANIDRKMFVCEFATRDYSAHELAEPLEKMRELGPSHGYEVAAGWKAGDNDRNCWIYYLLCRESDELEEPWQWRIFVHNLTFHESECYDSLHEFLSWYCQPYDWINWGAVQLSVNELHEKCKEALEG